MNEWVNFIMTPAAYKIIFYWRKWSAMYEWIDCGQLWVICI